MDITMVFFATAVVVGVIAGLEVLYLWLLLILSLKWPNWVLAPF